MGLGDGRKREITQGTTKGGLAGCKSILSSAVLSGPQFPFVKWDGQCYRAGPRGGFLRV